MPRNDDVRAGSPVRITTPLALLDRMAPRDARGEVILLGPGSREFHVTRGSGGETRCGGVAAFVVFLEARQAGLIAVVDENGPAWVLSRAGRLALRRARSAGSPSTTVPAATVATLAPHTAKAPGLDPAESPLAWLRRRKDKSGEPLITAVQFDAGERLRADIHFAGMGPRVTVNWSAVGGASGTAAGGLGVDIRDSVAGAQQRVRRALDAVGPMSAGLLIDVCGHLLGLERIERDRGWPPRSGKVGLQFALTGLACHYGLTGADGVRGSHAVQLRHWGADDYRPVGEAGAE